MREENCVESIKEYSTSKVWYKLVPLFSHVNFYSVTFNSEPSSPLSKTPCVVCLVVHVTPLGASSSFSFTLFYEFLYHRFLENLLFLCSCL